MVPTQQPLDLAGLFFRYTNLFGQHSTGLVQYNLPGQKLVLGHEKPNDAGAETAVAKPLTRTFVSRNMRIYSGRFGKAQYEGLS